MKIYKRANTVDTRGCDVTTFTSMSLSIALNFSSVQCQKA